MKTIVIAVVLLTGLLKCGGAAKTKDPVPVSCNVKASVVDFTGLDGCGVMLVLDDGTRLIPEKRVYIQAPRIEDDPLYYFTLTPGDKVMMSYKETNLNNICMAGTTAFITCITKID